MSDPIPFVIYKFETEWLKDPADPTKMKGRDWAEFGPPSLDGQVRTTTRELVSRLLDVVDQPRGLNMAVDHAKWRAEFIRKRYEDWKAGRETPEEGTPLSAWNGVAPEQGEILRTKGVKTIERLASLNDREMESIPLPGMRRLVEDAKRYIASLDTVRVAADLAAKDDKIAAQGAEIAEMREMLAEMMAEVKAARAEARDEDEPPAKRRPGRPRAEQQAAA
jgi:hypothetical protein